MCEMNSLCDFEFIVCSTACTRYCSENVKARGQRKTNFVSSLFSFFLQSERPKGKERNGYCKYSSNNLKYINNDSDIQTVGSRIPDQAAGLAGKKEKN